MTARLARMTQMLIMSPSTGMSELRVSCSSASRPEWPRRRCQVVEEVVAVKATDKTDDEEDEVAAGKRRV
jgi:hypothetical protein